jgi:cytochrome c-type biogenesis protein
VEKAMGGLLMLTGIAFLFDYVSVVSSYFQEWFPALERIG